MAQMGGTDALIAPEDKEQRIADAMFVGAPRVVDTLRYQPAETRLAPKTEEHSQLSTALKGRASHAIPASVIRCGVHPYSMKKLWENPKPHNGRPRERVAVTVDPLTGREAEMWEDLPPPPDTVAPVDHSHRKQILDGGLHMALRPVRTEQGPIAPPERDHHLRYEEHAIGMSAAARVDTLGHMRNNELPEGTNQFGDGGVYGRDGFVGEQFTGDRSSILRRPVDTRRGDQMEKRVQGVQSDQQNHAVRHNLVASRSNETAGIHERAARSDHGSAGTNRPAVRSSRREATPLAVAPVVAETPGIVRVPTSISRRPELRTDGHVPLGSTTTRRHGMAVAKTRLANESLPLPSHRTNDTERRVPTHAPATRVVPREATIERTEQAVTMDRPAQLPASRLVARESTVERLEQAVTLDRRSDPARATPSTRSQYEAMGHNRAITGGRSTPLEPAAREQAHSQQLPVAGPRNAHGHHDGEAPSERPSMTQPHRLDATATGPVRGVGGDTSEYSVAEGDRDAIHGTTLQTDRNKVYDDQYTRVLPVHDIPLTSSRSAGEQSHVPRSQGHANKA